MVFRGHIKNGMAVFDEPVSLPEGAEIKIEVIDPCGKETLAQRLKDIIGVATTLPADAAQNHDHYLYGTPRK